jgi:leader peptidase (prepilin peptidase)/N-methyltransferase
MMYFILTFFLGAAVGSFINVLIDRTMLGEDWVRGRSHCDNCHKELKWYDMIPVLSFIYFRGKSRCCRVPLTYRYPIVEILVGVLFVWWIAVGFWFFQLVNAPLIVIQPAFWLMTGVLLAILALADLFYGVVLMPVVWLGTIITIIYRLVLWNYGAYQSSDLLLSILLATSFFVFFYLLWKITKGKGMADGDMYVAMYMGLLLGWPKGLVAMMLSFVLGAIEGVFLILAKISGRKDSVPFVPFIIAAMVISLLWGERIIGFLS